ncbi:MAG: sodium:solute symporter [Chitinophagales bacterium]|nr:sodium:solute symporter [Chitinophagales bacterium]
MLSAVLLQSLSLNPKLILTIVLVYFLFLIAISFITSKDADNNTFFVGNRQSKWYLVAFGMIGASLSGVTFISVPGWVKTQQFAYMQMVFGYFFGYVFIAMVLMPTYYRLQLTSIYTYLEERFGKTAHKTGAAFFLISRTFGASFRLLLVAVVLQQFVMNSLGISFYVTVIITLVLIWLYTFKGGIKTIVITDTIQTTVMLVAVALTIYYIAKAMNLSFGDTIATIKNSDYSQIFFFNDFVTSKTHFIKQFFGGFLIAVAMTGLDQDMMQKNLSCKNIKDAQKNMLSFSVVIIFVNLLFLCLGALLYLFAMSKNIALPEKSDLLYPTIALQHLPFIIGLLFVVGLIAAAYSSADSALTSLTTSFCIDFLGFGRDTNKLQQEKNTRRIVHVVFSIIIFIIIILFEPYSKTAIIGTIFTVAGYTYGPLLGLYLFGMFTKIEIKDKGVIVVAIIAPLLTYLLSTKAATWFNGYVFGFELLGINAIITMLGLLLLKKQNIN